MAPPAHLKHNTILTLILPAPSYYTVPALCIGARCLLLLCAVGCTLRPDAPVAPVAPAWQPGGPEGLSAAIQSRLARYPTDGSWGYHWPPDDGIWFGTAEPVWYRGDLLSPGDPQRRSHCVGLTWELAMAALSAEAGGVDRPINGLSADQIRDLRRIWFVTDLGGRGAAEAVERYGVGISPPLREARPGDFLQLWACDSDGCASGHSAIFQSWIADTDGAVTGVRYWSTYPTTQGIGYQQAILGPGGFDPARTYLARLMPASAWRAPQ